MNQNKNKQTHDMQPGEGMQRERYEPDEGLLQDSYERFADDPRQDRQPEENLQLEEVLAQVEQCIAQLENPQISLEDSFRYYEEGIRKLRICNEKVDRIEKQMLVISNQGDLEDFGVR